MENEEVMPEAATQAARQAATESAPSGQHGQCRESAAALAMPIISAQGMESACFEAGIALANGAAESS